jgi:hypothetical protein
MDGGGGFTFCVTVVEAHGFDFDEDLAVFGLGDGCLAELEVIEPILLGCPLPVLGCHGGDDDG